MKTWNVKYKNENNKIEKRLLCQPKTFQYKKYQDGIQIKTEGYKGASELIEIITDIIIEDVFMDTAQTHMTELGYDESFIEGYISRTLINQVKKLPWRKPIKEKAKAILLKEDESVDVDLDVFILFQMHNEKEWVQVFLDLCDKEIQEQLIHQSLETLFDVIDEKDFVDESIKEDELDIQVKEDDACFIMMVDDEPRWDGYDLREVFNKLLIQSAYREDSLLFDEYADLIVLTLFANFYPVRSYTFESTEMAEKIKKIFETYDLSIDVMHE